MSTKWTQEPEETSPFLICCIYGPPGGCGALSSHVISWCLGPALSSSEAKHVLSTVVVLMILHCIFTSWLWTLNELSLHILTLQYKLTVKYSVYVLLCSTDVWVQCGNVYSGCWHLHTLHIPLRKPQLLHHIAPLFYYMCNAYICTLLNYIQMCLFVIHFCVVLWLPWHLIFCSGIKYRVLLSHLSFQIWKKFWLIKHRRN